MALTERERQILKKIEQNPMISQNELAEWCGITRSGVAAHISNLMKKGYIQGKGYVPRRLAMWRSSARPAAISQPWSAA